MQHIKNIIFDFGNVLFDLNLPNIEKMTGLKFVPDPDGSPGSYFIYGETNEGWAYAHDITRLPKEPASWSVFRPRGTRKC